MKTIYSYTNYRGVVCDLTAMLEYTSKDEVARLAGQYQRTHNLIAAIQSMHRAGEYELARQIVREQLPEFDVLTRS